MAAVNKPTDVKLKDADVNRKLQVYGIFQAFQNGKFPSNEQIDVALNSFLATKALSSPSQRLSEEGRALVGDVRNVVEEAKRLLLSKNSANLLQDFLWQTTHFDPKSTSTPNAPVDKETAKQHGNDALEGLRTLGTLIITNGQFRKLLQDCITLLRDMAADAASNAANKVRPPGEALADIDAPAQDNTWHDAPDFSKDNIKKQVQGTYKNNVNSDSKVAQADTTADAKNLATNPDQATAVAGEVGDAAKAKAQEQRARTKEYLKRKVPQDRRDQTIFRLKKALLECQQHPEYQQAIQTLLDLATQYGGHAKNLGAQSTGTVQDARSNTPLAQAEADLKTLIERFANGTSTDSLWDSISTIYQDADRDPELKDWFKAVDRYIRRCLQQQGYILDDESTNEWNRLHDHGNYLLRDKYRGHTDSIVDEAKFLFDQFDKDEQNRTFAESLKKLFHDLGNDDNGKPQFKPHLIKDLTDVILPAVFENVAYIPVPRIEYTDPEFDAIIENLVLESDNFMPNVLEIASENYFRWGRKKVASKSKHAFEVKVAGIQCDLRDVSYHIKRKKGFPTITDTGVANLVVARDGLTFRLKMRTADEKDSQNFLLVDKVDVDVKSLNVTLSKSKHKLLFNLFKPLMLRVVKPALQKAIEKAIKDYVNKMDRLLFQMKREADKALDEAIDDPENLPNIYRRYFEAAKTQALQAKKKAEDAVADKKVNYAVTKEDSMFPDIHLPGGISSKATEYKEMARKGDKWESPIFSIGSASKSSNIPPPPHIVKKSHGSTSNNLGSGLGSTQPGANGHSYPATTGRSVVAPTAY